MVLGTADIDAQEPYDLPAKHYHHLVSIRYFGDGNRRTSRNIPNHLVMKFTGHLIPVGDDDKEKEMSGHMTCEDDKEKDEFLGIDIRGSEKYHEEDGEVYLDEQRTTARWPSSWS
ncbi:hypothetical protein F4801DRAFT_582781 [Xylaria longipes]|nr:hypothetical protein F4801DRAFT_582781 [Xylaria longipes]